VSGVLPDRAFDLPVFVHVSATEVGFLKRTVPRRIRGHRDDDAGGPFRLAGRCRRGVSDAMDALCVGVAAVRPSSGVREGTGINIVPARDVAKAWVGVGAVLTGRWFERRWTPGTLPEGLRRRSHACLQLSWGHRGACWQRFRS
jgi:hypothetical protein